MVRKVQPCGTRAAYERHRRAGEEADEACKAANARATQQAPTRPLLDAAVWQAHKHLKATHQDQYRDLVEVERKRTHLSAKAAPGRATNALAQAHRKEYRLLVARFREQLAAGLAGEPTPTSRYRTGSRDEQARTAHNRESRAWRRAATLRRFAPVEQAILDQIAAGVGPRLAAERYGMTIQSLTLRGTWDPDWRNRLDQALLRGRDPDLTHGTAHTYRARGCRCPECRQAHDRHR